MSPEAKRSFEAEWAVLSRRLRLLLARKRVDPAQHDDLLQETALRLVSMWDSVDRRRELWPLTVTIALNLLRDRGRVVNKDDLVGELPEMRSLTDVETAGIARMELAKVREAMNQLSDSHRSILMREIGGHSGAALPDAAADKMLRMRARRKLRSALEKVSGLVALRFRRFGDLLEGLVVIRETGVTVASCAFCLALGVGGVLVPTPALVPEASAGTVQGGAVTSAAALITRVGAAGMGDAGRVLDGAVAEARAAVAEGRLAEQQAARRAEARARTRRAGSAGTSNSDPLPPLPLPGEGDGPQEIPSLPPAPEPDTDSLPTTGDDAPAAPPVNPPSPPPPPPGPPGDAGDSAGDPLAGAKDVVEGLL